METKRVLGDALSITDVLHSGLLRCCRVRSLRRLAILRCSLLLFRQLRDHRLRGLGQHRENALSSRLLVSSAESLILRVTVLCLFVYRYRFANFLFLLTGCCCTYSLLNVTSIVIKQGLNCIIQKVECRNQDMAARHLPRRKSSLSTMYFSKRRGTRIVGRDSMKGESLGTPRRLSGELISMKDFFSANKVALAVMQKQLDEMAQMEKGSSIDRNSV